MSMEGKEELEFSEHFGKIVEDFYLPKTPKIFTSQYSEESSLLREEEDDIKKAKSLLKKRSFDLKREFPRKPLRKTKSFSNHFLANIEELANSVNRGFDETDLSRSLSHGNEEISFVSIDDSSWPSERSSDIAGTKYPKPEDRTSDQFSPIDEEEDPDKCCQKEIQNIEPVFPIYLKFNDINYKVRLNEKNNFGVERSILHGVSGSVCPGEVLALMGPSGGGKTTLLNLLSGRVKNNGGTITYNDQLYTKSLKRRIGFVLQDDIVFPHLTVKETLTYAALLRLPSTFSSQQKKERAMNIIIELGLERCQDTMIGGAFVRGISGGERKRVCIGNEILLNPSLLFLDEPTSGLDSTTALHIIQMLRNIAQAGKTVLTTIHQPSSRLFSKFDKLILLSKGCSLYFGKASEAMVYFSSIGCTPLIPMNPAEFLIDLANGNIKDKSIPSELEDRLLPAVTNFERPSPGDVHEYLAGIYRLRTSNVEKLGLHKSIVLEGKLKRLTSCNSTEWGASWCEQVGILFKRGFKERYHHYLSSLHIIQVISTAIIVGLLWWHSDTSSQRRVQDQAGLLFFISVFWAFFPLFTAIHTFPQERAMLAKERSVDMYKLSAYLVARNTSDLPLDLALPIIFLVVVYFMANLKTTFSAFFLTLLTVFLSIIAAQGLGLAIGAAFMDVKKATSLASVTVMAFMLSGGFFIQKVPAFMSWIRYISLNYHTYRLLLQIQYSCNEGASGPVICDSPFIKGQRLNPRGTEVGAIFTMIIGYRILTYIFLRRMKSRKITQ